MKKTIITLMALAGVAVGQDTVTWTYDASDLATGNTVTLTDVYFKSGNSAAFAYTLDLNVSNLVSTLIGTKETPVTLSGSEGVILSYFESNSTVVSVALGLWGNDGLVLQGARTVNGCDAKNVTASGLVTVKGDAYTTVSDETNSLTTASSKYNYANPEWWSDVSAATLTFTSEGKGADSYSAVLSVTKNGIVYDVTSTCSNANAKLATFGTTSVVGINTNFVNSISIVPEPTTATLSLLALCGLAARRRRK